MRLILTKSRIIYAVLLLILLNLHAYAEKMPFAQNVLYGKLENGLQYYIMQNNFPADKVEMRLNVRSGSLNETEQERGLAHFVEHMAFNGTKHYKGNDLIKEMEAMGLSFGQHSNAYTSEDVTNYQLSFPVDNKEFMSKSFIIMRDWADGLLFDAEEIEKEKGVIIEEWRMRNDVRQRLRSQFRGFLLEGSKYPEREPIGLVEVIKKADAKLLRGYYDKWYVPENMSIVIVGNIDPKVMEKEIKDHFSSMASKKSPVHADKNIKVKNDLRFKIVSDPEAKSLNASYVLIKGNTVAATYEEAKKTILRAGAFSMLNKRVFAKINEKKSALVSFRGGVSQLTPNVSSVVFTVTSKPETLSSDIDLMLEEIETAKRYGFTQAQLNEFVTSTSTFLERAAQPDYKYPSTQYVSSILEYDNNGGYLTDFAQDKELFTRVFAETELKDYQNAFVEIIDTKDAVAYISVPERDRKSVKYGIKDFRKAVKNAQQKKIAEPEAEKVLKSLIKEEPVAGTVVKRVKLENLDAEELTLSNGIRFIIKYNPAEKDKFVLSASKKGGLWTYPDDKYLTLSVATQVASRSGFKGISARDLQLFNAGKQVQVSTAAGDNVFNLSGGGDSRDMETLFQLIHLTFTAADMDENAFQAWKKSTETQLLNQEKDKQTLFQREVSEDIYSENYRRGWLETSDLPKLNVKSLAEIYADAFSDAENFVFTISGDIDRAETEKLAAKYLGSLKPTGKKAEYNYKYRDIKTGHIVKEGFGDAEQRTSVGIYFDKDIKIRENGKYIIPLVRRILNTRLRETIREDMGGVYAVGARVGYYEFPEPNLSGSISFNCDPERRTEVIKAVMTEMKRFSDAGATEKELEQAKLQQITLYDTIKDENRFWASNINSDTLNGETTDTIEKRKEITLNLKLEEVNALIKDYLDGVRTYTSIYNPEKAQ